MSAKMQISCLALVSVQPAADVYAQSVLSVSRFALPAVNRSLLPTLYNVNINCVSKLIYSFEPEP